jgi:hypothetical protein
VEQAKASLKRLREDENAQILLPIPTKKRKTFPIRKVGGTKKFSKKNKAKTMKR